MNARVGGFRFLRERIELGTGRCRVGRHDRLPPRYATPFWVAPKRPGRCAALRSNTCPAAIASQFPRARDKAFKATLLAQRGRPIGDIPKCAQRHGKPRPHVTASPRRVDETRKRAVRSVVQPAYKRAIAARRERTRRTLERAVGQNHSVGFLC